MSARMGLIFTDRRPLQDISQTFYQFIPCALLNAVLGLVYQGPGKQRTLEQHLDRVSLFHVEIRSGLIIANSLTVEEQADVLKFMRRCNVPNSRRESLERGMVKERPMISVVL